MTPDESRPRVLVITPDFPPSRGGIQLLQHRFASLASRVRVRVVTRDHPRAHAWDEASGLDVHRAAVVPRSRRAGLVMLNALSLKHARAFRPDVVLCGHIVGAPAALVAGRMLDVPVVAYLYADEGPAQPRLARLAFGSARATIVLGRYGRELAVALGAPAGRVTVIEPGVDAPAAPRAARSDEPVLVTVARLSDRYKGHDVVLDALPAICERVGTVRWIVIGDGPLRAELEARTRSLSLGDAVQFIGHVGDAERDEWLDRATVFVMPSRLPPSGAGGEGFGIAYLEAGAHRLPVVAGDVAGARDAVVDGETGVLVEPSSPADVADAVSGLLLDPARATRMGAAGARRAAELSWPRMVSRLEDVLLDAVARP
jgi:phosphatidylinositol alpha-1,6-mannosyltransferase